MLKIKQKEVMALPASLRITPATSAPRYRKWWTQQRKGHYHLKLQSTGQSYLRTHSILPSLETQGQLKSSGTAEWAHFPLSLPRSLKPRTCESGSQASVPQPLGQG